MPTKNNHNKPILLDEVEFLNAKESSNEKDLEKRLIAVMALANERYDIVYRAHKAEPDIEKFSYCSENFKKIKSVIESKENPTLLTNKLYLEAWISTLYSDVHALNLDPKTQKQFDELNKKIEAIETDFNQLLTKKSSLDLKQESSAKLLKYINDFQDTWKTKKNMLKGHYHYNYAESLVEKSKIELEDKSNGQMNYAKDAMTLLAKAANFYTLAELLDFADQTKQRIKKLEKAAKELQASANRNHFSSLSDKKLVVVLTKISPSSENKRIKTESLWTASFKKDKLPDDVDQPILPLVTQKKVASDEIKPTRGKRKSFDDINPAKKVKKDPSIVTYPKKTGWKTECQQLLNELEQIGLEKYKLPDPYLKDELTRYKASLASNFALDNIEKLIFSEKNLSDTEKLESLKKIENCFLRSIDFYTQVGLIKEKDKVEGCVNILTSSIKKLSPVTSPKEKPTFDKQVVCNREFVSPTRYTRTFFKNLSCDNATKVDNQPNLTKN